MLRPLLTLTLAAAIAMAQVPHAALPPLPAPQAVPKPGPPATEGAYAPQPILPGGIVVPLFPPNSPYLKADKIKEPEVYNMSTTVPGRINSIVSIHNPSIEVHTVDRGLNTGAAVILAAGGGYNPQTDEVYDALQAIRLVRAYAKEWNIDPNKIGIMGFSAGAELSAPAAVQFPEFDAKNNDPSDPLAGITSRPDFVGIIYPGPSPFTRNRTAPPIPRNVPPAFITCGGSGD